MAMHSTTKRYSYIYGSAAPKMAVGPTSEYKNKSKKKGTVKKGSRKTVAKAGGYYGSSSSSAGKMGKKDPKKKNTKKNQKKFLAVDRGFTMILLLSVFLVAASCFIYVSKSSDVSKLTREVKQLKSEQAQILTKHAALKSEIDKSLNLEEIQEYAEKTLQMKYPKGSNVIYYINDSSDYFRQYGSVEAGE